MHYFWLEVLTMFLQNQLVLCDGAFQNFALRRQNMQMKSNYVFREMIANDLVFCASLCSLHGCLAISFKSNEMRCQLGNEDVTNLDVDVHYTRQPGWTTMSRKVYTVYNRRSLLGPYKIPFEDARSTCESENATLASEADLLESRALGFYHCGFGWLSNGRIGLVLQRPSSCTSYPFTDGVIYRPTQPTSNVWCREIIARDLEYCASLCSLHECLAISFKSDEMRCQLGYEDVTNHDVDYHFTRQPGWTTMSRKRFTVYNRRSLLGPYKIPFEDARSTCESENATLASEADLLESRALGFYHCGFGWLSNGQIGLVLQRPSSCTSYPFTDGVIYRPTQPTSNVWCRF